MPRPPMRPNEISSGGVVFRRSADGVEICLVNDGRYWGFPKGLIEPGETPEVAALREISEETGIALEVLVLTAALPLTEYVYRRRDSGALIFKRVHHFLVEAPAGNRTAPRSGGDRRSGMAGARRGTPQAELQEHLPHHRCGA